MPFSSTAVSAALVCRFDLPAQVDDHHPYTYGDFLLHTKQDAAFFKRTHSDRGETFTDFVLVIDHQFFRVAPHEKGGTNKSRRKIPLIELHFVSYAPLSSELKQKAQRIAREINLADLGIEHGKLMRRILIDKTLPPKPRSISRLRIILNKLAHKTDKSIFIHSMESFVPLVLSAGEADIMHADIRSSYGKHLSEKALLIFELGYEKCKDKIGKIQ